MLHIEFLCLLIVTKFRLPSCVTFLNIYFLFLKLYVYMGKRYVHMGTYTQSPENVRPPGTGIQISLNYWMWVLGTE